MIGRPPEFDTDLKESFRHTDPPRECRPDET
jgi:hypothetical protein